MNLGFEITRCLAINKTQKEKQRFQSIISLSCCSTGYSFAIVLVRIGNDKSFHLVFRLGMFATIILLYGGVRYEVSCKLSTEEQAETMWNLIFWILCVLINFGLLAIVFYALLCLTDLEVDQMDPFVATANINRWILIEFALQAALSILLLFTGHWILFLVAVPLTFYHAMLSMLQSTFLAIAFTLPSCLHCLTASNGIVVVSTKSACLTWEIGFHYRFVLFELERIMVLDRRMHDLTTISSMIILLPFHMGFVVYLQ
ncbi:hypothetical protein DKX38_023790 [Salix brachista]|uniref:Uncharacterized protein n=1 Tax=Salix brachista TaxID=2182728 RepID=A0A5N5JJQ4_9ROSI|nr:hypothetical protein DKX38_023790 [Salix brachista]